MATIVVADDDDDLRALSARVLRRAGHTVVEAADGSAALQAVRRSRPDAVVSDIDMPTMTGLDLCRSIRSEPLLHDVPVVLVSGSIVPGDPRPADVQATALLRKPFRAGDLTGCVDRALAGGHTPGQAPVTCP